MINPRTKGQSGEREIADKLNEIYQQLRIENGFPAKEKRDLPFQRNQNQSAVGGSDLSNPFLLEIEVKRQETLNVKQWWAQCVASAARTGGEPVLVYRQNRKAWRVVLWAQLEPFAGEVQTVQADISFEDFIKWVTAYLGYYI